MEAPFAKGILHTLSLSSQSLIRSLPDALRLGQVTLQTYHSRIYTGVYFTPPFLTGLWGPWGPGLPV